MSGRLQQGVAERTVWHWVPVVLAPVTAAIAVWNLAESADGGGLDAAGWFRGLVGVAAPLIILVTWLFVWRRSDDARARITMMAVATVGIFGATWSHPGLAGALSFAMPLTWLVAATTRSAMLWTCTIMASATTGLVMGGIADPWIVVFTAAFSIALSAAIGFSLARLQEQVDLRQQLLEELQQKQDEVALLSAEGAAERERAAVLRDVHDAVTQNLTAIVMQSRTPGHDPALIEELAAEALEETRALLVRATPRQLEAGVTTAIERLAHRLERETGVSVTTELAVIHQSLEGEIVLLRAAQESLANIRRHAEATAVSVVLQADEGATVLTVSDDGRGATQQTLLGGRGLSGVRERVLQAGGTFSVEGSQGTTITISLPEAHA